jgi:uncharacterized protein (TIGR02680 family)
VSVGEPQPGLWGRPAAEDGADGAPPPPSPGRERFQPLRAGILNLWQYDEQELRFHQGRLILRGDNGTGKSKALELLLPFLLDADLSPHRLDPFAGTARTMRWNLLEGGRHESRVGYVWLELGRLEDGETPSYVTLGCGLRASAGVDRVDSWYFVTSRRVGLDLELTEGRTPRTKDRLRKALGDEGTLYDQGGEYRERIDGILYGLGRDRFHALRHLMLQLRRPHLSEKLDPASLSELLTESLPPVDPELIAQLSQGFERLEHDQEELRRVQAAHRAVESFLATYREYAAGAARVRAAGMRQADSGYHKTAAEARQARDELARVDAELEALAESLLSAASELDEIGGRIRALEASDAMRSAEALREREERAAELRRRADDDRRIADRDAAEHTRRRQEAETADERAAGAGRTVEQAEERAYAAAREIGQEETHRLWAERASEDPDGAAAGLRAITGDRLRGLAEVAGLGREAAEARGDHARAETRRKEAEAQAEGAAERSRRARSALRAAHDDLLDALAGWAEEATELALSPEERQALAEATEPGAGDPGGGDPGGGAETALPAAIARRVAVRRDALVRRRSEAESELAEVEAARREVETERERVAVERDLPPEAPRTREADRTGRPGAPLYLLCDFAPGLSETEQADLEAALESSGLLDAWVLPDGEVLDPATRDTWLAPGSAPEPPPAGRALADLLIPRPGRGVAEETVTRVLAAVAVGDPEPPGPGPLVGVGPDGGWRLGPLRGSWSKERAEHVGAAARESAHRRRLAELDARLDELAEERTRREAVVEALAARLTRLEAEAAAAPSTAPLVAAHHAARAAADDETRRRDELAEAERSTAGARRAREASEAKLQERAGALRLAPWIDDLEGYRTRLDTYRDAGQELLRSASAARAAAESAARAAELDREAGERAREAERRAGSSDSAARRALAEAEELRASVGAEAREVVARHGREVAARDRLRNERERWEEERSARREERGRIDGKIEALESQLGDWEASRTKAAERLRRVAEAGLLSLALPAERVPEEAPAEWSMTRALEVARAVEEASAERVPDVSDAAMDRRANRSHERFREMEADLGVEFRAGLEHHDDLLTVRVVHDRREFDAPDLLAMLEGEIGERRRLLEERERELLRSFLLGEVGDHLRGRLREAHTLVEGMNRDLEGCATASGMTLRLSWRADGDAEAPVRRAVELLRRDPGFLSDAEQRELAGFFERRIETARQAGDARPWRDHLLAALDYRRWYRFVVQRRLPGESGWKPLTRHGHAAASGGEKAVALHLPLFAAASAHYRSAVPTAPRLILLDEAFAGIDVGMRGRCMALLVEFDLDFMMTSHDEWGCYRELPGVATYSLFRDPALGGVAAIRSVWNGERLEETDGEPSRAAGTAAER